MMSVYSTAVLVSAFQEKSCLVDIDIQSLRAVNIILIPVVQNQNTQAMTCSDAILPPTKPG